MFLAVGSNSEHISYCSVILESGMGNVHRHVQGTQIQFLLGLGYASVSNVRA